MYLILDVYATPNTHSSRVITLEAVWYDYTEEAIVIDSTSESYYSLASKCEYEVFINNLRDEILSYPTIADICAFRAFVNYPDVDGVGDIDDGNISDLDTFRSLLAHVQQSAT